MCVCVCAHVLTAEMGSGHYYAFVKNSNGIWYEMDDDQVLCVCRCVWVGLCVGVGGWVYASVYVSVHFPSSLVQDDDHVRRN